MLCFVLQVWQQADVLATIKLHCLQPESHNQGIVNALMAF